jgi:hypothetical protein
MFDFVMQRRTQYNRTHFECFDASHYVRPLRYDQQSTHQSFAKWLSVPLLNSPGGGQHISSTLCIIPKKSSYLMGVSATNDFGLRWYNTSLQYDIIKRTSVNLCGCIDPEGYLIVRYNIC